MSTTEQKELLDNLETPEVNPSPETTDLTTLDHQPPPLITEPQVPTDSESTPPKVAVLKEKRVPKAPKPPKSPKELAKMRYTWSLSLSPAENDYVETIYQARLAAGLAKDRNHFLKTTLDFALNSRSVKGLVFAVPEGLPVQHLENGFFNKK